MRAASLDHIFQPMGCTAPGCTTLPKAEGGEKETGFERSEEDDPSPTAGVEHCYCISDIAAEPPSGTGIATPHDTLGPKVLYWSQVVYVVSQLLY